jgi:serine acetyltransferase
VTSSDSIINVVGSADPWVAEILDVVHALGMESRVVEVGPSEGARFGTEDTIELAEVSLSQESLVFTGSYLDPSLKGELYSRYVFEPFRALLNWQQNHGLSNWVNLVHPQAWVSPTAQLGRDVFVGANTSIGAHTVIRDHVRVNRNVSVGHDVTIEEGCEIAPLAAISSGVTVGSWVFIGAGAVILNGLTIGQGATIGAGSVVTRDVPAGLLVLGNPAKPR